MWLMERKQGIIVNVAITIKILLYGYNNWLQDIIITILLRTQENKAY